MLGFVYALELADNAIRLGKADYALVIGSETFSRIIDWNDRSTCVLFGDGSGAVILKSIDEDSSSSILSNHLFILMAIIRKCSLWMVDLLLQIMLVS